MFNPEDFELPLEKQLRLRVITKEVDECSDLDALKENLKNCAESLMRYQHLLAKAVEHNLQNAMSEMLSTMGIEDIQQTDA